MSHFGNIDHETAAAVADLEHKLAGKDYSARGVNGRNQLVIELHLQNWSGERGWRLFLRCHRMVRQVFRGGLMKAWALTEGGQSK